MSTIALGAGTLAGLAWYFGYCHLALWLEGTVGVTITLLVGLWDTETPDVLEAPAYETTDVAAAAALIARAGDVWRATLKDARQGFSEATAHSSARGSHVMSD
jgi:hypothetical protein